MPQVCFTPYIEDKGRYWRESLHVDHGQRIRKVTLARAHEEQPGHSRAASVCRLAATENALSNILYLDAAMMEALRPP